MPGSSSPHKSGSSIVLSAGWMDECVRCVKDCTHCLGILYTMAISVTKAAPDPVSSECLVKTSKTHPCFIAHLVHTVEPARMSEFREQHVELRCSLTNAFYTYKTQHTHGEGHDASLPTCLGMNSSKGPNNFL